MFESCGLGCTHAGPNSAAFRTPFQPGMGLGGLHRAVPTGGSAYGMPLKTRSLPSIRPSTSPAAACTVGLGLIGIAAPWVVFPSAQYKGVVARPPTTAIHMIR